MTSIIIEEKNPELLLRKMLLYILKKYSGEKLNLKSALTHKILLNRHTDIKFIFREEGKTSISIDQIKQIPTFISFYAYESNIKTIAIVNAQEMTTQAQNALLKTLEDHGENTLFVLGTDSHKNLLPTIQSRCSILRNQNDIAKKIDISNLIGFLSDKGKKNKEKSLNSVDLQDIDALFTKKEINKRELALRMLNKTMEEERNKLSKYTIKQNQNLIKSTLDKLALLKKLIRMVEKNTNPRLAVENYIIFKHY